MTRSPSETGRTSPEGYPQPDVQVGGTGTTTNEAKASPDPKWVKGVRRWRAAFRKRDAGAEAS